MSPTFAQAGPPCKFSIHVGRGTRPPRLVSSMFIQHPSPPTGAIPFALSCLLSSLVVPCVEAQAQEAVVRMEENLRAEPNGVILGSSSRVPGYRWRVGTEAGRK